MKKTTIYIDIDDDIAAIIEKLEVSEQKIVALVLPKRPSVLQSSVNLQLLKKSAEDEAKNLVLITNDDQVMQLAGEAGLHVSTSLQSKPFIPSPAVQIDSDEPLLVDADSPVDGDPAQPEVFVGDKKVDLSTPIGDLVEGEEDEIELPDEEPEAIDEPAEGKSPKNKIKVPNFGKFRTKVIGGGVALLAVIGLLVWALVFAPSAKILIKTEKSEMEAKLSLTASTSVSTVDAEKGEVPAVKKDDVQKLTGTFVATGQKDVGEKASGTITINNCDYSDGFTLPAGTRFSNSGKVFVSTKAVSVPEFTGPSFLCDLDGNEAGSASVDVVADQSGDSYNLSARGYTISSIPSEAKVEAVGSAMGGGTTKIVKVVTQEDVDTAKTKVLESAADNVKGKLSKILSDEGLIAIEETFTTSEGAPSSSIPVGQEAPTDPTLTIDLTSSMLGMKKSDIEPLLTTELNKKIDTAKQKVYESGASSSRITISERPNPDTAKITLIATSSVGPNLDIPSITSEIAGKKAGEAKQLLESRPGVSGVEIDLDPFWVFSIPKKTSKVTVTINE